MIWNTSTHSTRNAIEKRLEAPMTSMAPTQRTRHDVTSVSSRFLDDVLRYLSTPQKTLPSKYFYDAEGSRLFEAIWL